MGVKLASVRSARLRMSRMHPMIAYSACVPCAQQQSAFLYYQT